MMRLRIFGFIIILIFSFQCLTAQNICPQNNGYRMIRLYYENASGEKGLSTFDYDDQGYIYTGIWELMDGSRSSMNFYECDEKGNNVKLYREFSDSLRTTMTFTYDENNNLVADSFNGTNGRVGTGTYEYDTEGRLILVKCRKQKGWLTADLKYKYNDKGQIISADIIGDEGKAGEITFTYDEHGNKLTEFWDFDGKWSQTFKWEYEKIPAQPAKVFTSSNPFIPTSPNVRIKKENYDYNGKIGGPSFYEYDKTGKLRKKRFERSDGFSTVMYFLYDAQGRLTKAYRQYSNGMTAVLTYIFDDHGNFIERTVKKHDGTFEKGSYVYIDSHLTKAIYENYDSWLTGEINFKYDGNRLVSGHFAGQDGTSADIIFDNNAADYPIKIQWDFSFGAHQTYTFEYK